MFCPKCATASETTEFCRKCGFKLENLQNFVEANGELNSRVSARQKGIKRGVNLILLSAILFPLYVFLAPLFPANDALIESSPSTTVFEQISWAIMTTLFVAGLIRIVYAFVFEMSAAKLQNKTVNQQKSFKTTENQNALPPSQETPISDFGKWKQTTGELFEPIFVNRKTSGELK